MLSSRLAWVSGRLSPGVLRCLLPAFLNHFHAGGGNREPLSQELQRDSWG